MGGQRNTSWYQINFNPGTKDPNGSLPHALPLSVSALLVSHKKGRRVIEAQFDKELELIQVMIPMLMRMVKRDANYSVEKSDCGLFTIKFIEFLHVRMNVKVIDEKRFAKP
ncbi:HXXXD-type acyl-transferase family protein [Striga asiatica]|uniref:HXXXD-type acyl-transferase family protein n=1 Tax=Striga asiatica TaxID=4170 RepID=A0A5A7PKG9_STRAF|nr:HXXXD-type acyl-transferase family protein [Striga asiatica]